MDGQILYHPANCRTYSLIALVPQREESQLQCVWLNRLFSKAREDQQQCVGVSATVSIARRLKWVSSSHIGRMW